EEIEEVEELLPVDDIISSSDNFPKAAELIISIEDPDFYEDLTIGSPVDSESKALSGKSINFVAEVPSFLVKPVSDAEEVEDVEEIPEVEELPSEPYFAMTKFGQNEQPVLELRGDTDTIVEHDGIYSIADNLPYTNVLLNKEFKTLVDSVLQG
nr:hypothetical protein [Treponema sp.]